MLRRSYVEYSVLRRLAEDVPPASTVLVAVALTTLEAGPDGLVRAADDGLAAITGLSYSSVRRARLDLQARGLAVVVAGDGKAPSTYDLRGGLMADVVVAAEVKATSAVVVAGPIPVATAPEAADDVPPGSFDDFWVGYGAKRPGSRAAAEKLWARAAATAGLTRRIFRARAEMNRRVAAGQLEMGPTAETFLGRDHWKQYEPQAAVLPARPAPTAEAQAAAAAAVDHTAPKETRYAV